MQHPVSINVPISVSYAALERVVQQQLVNTFIPKPEPDTTVSPYAQILGVGLTGSSAGTYNLLLQVQLKILRTVLKRDKVDLYASVALAFDNDTQQLYVRHFVVEAHTTSGFYNTALQVLINKVAYPQIIQKARIDLKQLLATELDKLNSQLAQGLAVPGLNLTGAVAGIAVQDITFTPDELTLRAEAQGNLHVAIHDLLRLLPPNAPEV